MSIFILLLFVGALLIVITMAAKVGTRLFAFVTWRKSAIFVGAYLICLILFVPLTAILPNNGFLKSETKARAGDQFSKNFPKFTDIKTRYAFDQLQGLYLNSSQTFEVNEESIRLDCSKGTEYTQVLAERKTVDDGKLEVRTYLTPHSIGEVDFTDSIKPPNVSLQGRVLMFKPVHQSLTFKLFKPNYTQSQFVRGDSLNTMTSMNFGSGIVFLRVPKSLQIDESTNPVEFLDND